jgi:hypothetical protein
MLNQSDLHRPKHDKDMRISQTDNRQRLSKHSLLCSEHKELRLLLPHYNAAAQQRLALPMPTIHVHDSTRQHCPTPFATHANLHPAGQVAQFINSLQRLHHRYG